MKELEERIRLQGTVKPGNVLKVDAFLNHQCDVELFDRMGAAWAEHFADKTINKILTIEASGIGIACVAARHFDNAPVVFAKKAQSINLDGDQYTTTVYSFTKQKEFPVIVSKRYLNEGDHVLLLDDFLANGKAMMPERRSRASASRWRRVSKVAAMNCVQRDTTLIPWQSWSRWIRKPVPSSSAPDRRILGHASETITTCCSSQYE